jgi:hypothetical protein
MRVVYGAGDWTDLAEPASTLCSLAPLNSAALMLTRACCMSSHSEPLLPHVALAVDPALCAALGQPDRWEEGRRLQVTILINLSLR